MKRIIIFSSLAVISFGLYQLILILQSYIEKYYRGGALLLLISYFSFWVVGVLFGCITYDDRKTCNNCFRNKVIGIIMSMILAVIPICDIVLYYSGNGILYSIMLSECLSIGSGFILFCNKNTSYMIIKNIICITYLVSIYYIADAVSSIAQNNYSIIRVIVIHFLFIALGIVFGQYKANDSSQSHRWLTCILLFCLSILSILLDSKVITTNYLKDSIHVIDILLGYNIHGLVLQVFIKANKSTTKAATPPITL